MRKDVIKAVLLIIGIFMLTIGFGVGVALLTEKDDNLTTSEENNSQENNNQVPNSNVERYEVTEYFYIADEKKFLKGTPVDITNVVNNQRIFDSALATNYPNLYNIVKNILHILPGSPPVS